MIKRLIDKAKTFLFRYLVREVVRLEASQYQRLERDLLPPTIDNQTSDLAAGYRLGIQATLRKLREGYVL